MGFSNRDYSREDYGERSGLARAGQWLWNGRVPLFRAFGIDVQAHSMLVIAIVLTLLFLPMSPGFRWQDAVISAALLFGVVLLHEFGHCFGARWVGGEADQIVMHPLGGLALTQPPTNWRAHLITTLAGPAVNVLICVVCGIGLFALVGSLPWQPFPRQPFVAFRGWLDPAWLLFWIYQTSWTLLLFNLLPIYPLDGGRAVQEIAWARVGYYKSMLVAANTGMVGAIVFGMVAIATGQLGLLILAGLGVFSCYQMKQQLAEMGPFGFSEYDDPITASMQQAYRDNRRSNRPTKRSKRGQRTMQRLAAQAKRERDQAAAAEAEIDRILAKVSASGMHSLTRGEQRTLKDATARQQRESEKSAR